MSKHCDTNSFLPIYVSAETSGASFDVAVMGKIFYAMFVSPQCFTCQGAIAENETFTI